MLLSSHLIPEVEQVCVLSRGTPVREGTIDELRGGDHRLLVRARPLADAAKVLAAQSEVDEVTAIDDDSGGDVGEGMTGGLRVTATEHAAPSLNGPEVYFGPYVSGGHALAVLITYLVLFLALSAFLLRRDVT